MRGRELTIVVAVGLGLSLMPGRGAASIAEQRARLPPPAECPDPVAGIWRSHTFNEGDEDWTKFTLDVRRKPDSETELEGTIVNLNWYGPKTEVERGPCEHRLQYEVTMQAAGSYVDDVLEFHGTQWELTAALCATEDPFLYNLDAFSGVVDHEIQEFQSVNNDGGRYVNMAMVFRRTQCHDVSGVPEARPQIEVAPPYYPPKSERGCGVSD